MHGFSEAKSRQMQKTRKPASRYRLPVCIFSHRPLNPAGVQRSIEQPRRFSSIRLRLQVPHLPQQRFVCSHQTIVCCRQTIVCSHQTMVCCRQTKKRRAKSNRKVGRNNRKTRRSYLRSSRDGTEKAAYFFGRPTSAIITPTCPAALGTERHRRPTRREARRQLIDRKGTRNR